VVNEWHAAWDILPGAEQAQKKARQGVPLSGTRRPRRARSRHHGAGQTRRRDHGEVMMRGNVVMKGYLKNKASDREGLHRRLVFTPATSA